MYYPFIIVCKKIVVVSIDLTWKISVFINLSKCNVTLGMRPSHDQRCVPMETPRTNCAVSENPFEHAHSYIYI